MSGGPEVHCFQYTPFGIIPYGEPVPSTGESVNHASGETVRVAVSAPSSPRASATQSPSASVIAPAFDPSKPLTGAQLFAAARARIKEIDRQLRSVPALQLERAQLSALMLAAKSTRKPRKNVQ